MNERTIHPVPLRSPETVLRLDRMGSFHQTRLSFMRVLLRRLARERWQVARVIWDIDARGQGTAVYEARGNGRVYSLVAFGHDLDPAKRTDRVIAEEWDATFVLHDGVVSNADIERLARNVPLQEAGRCSASELVLARANRSVRLFDHVVACLAAGRQPATQDLDAVGYLMRTTAVYGSGKFGLADRERIAARAEFSGPFAAEMLTVWLIRAFTTDLVEHMAALSAPGLAVKLDRSLRRRLGVGNATGLGMAPFVVNHPGLFHRWISARETALARVLSVKYATNSDIAVFHNRLTRGMRQIAEWRTDDPVQSGRIEGLVRDLDRLAEKLGNTDLHEPFAWQDLFSFASAELDFEAQELLVTLLLEPYGALIDDLAATMAGDEAPDFHIDGGMTIASLRDNIERSYRQALETDFAAPEQQARFWYVSEEKLEPRLGERVLEAGSERELPLAVARDVANLHRAVASLPPATTIATFLAQHPEQRHVVRRVQLTARSPYAEIRDNLLSREMRPIDILRCKLSFFGATDFDPRSDRWVRIALYRHAPFPDELHSVTTDDWAIPPSSHDVVQSLDHEKAPPWSPSPGIAEAQGYSLNEIDAQLKKAARGAGLPWGLAEEAGRYGRALAQTSPQHLSIFADALDDLYAERHGWRLYCDGNNIRAADARPLSALALAPTLSDFSSEVERGAILVASTIALPCLLAPVLSDIANRKCRRLSILAPWGEIEIGNELGEVASQLANWNDMESAKISIRPRSAQVSSPTQFPVRGIAIPAPLWQRFESLARLTYVPATLTSRLAGAGAGLLDND
jgi:hypothetical protein